MNLLLGYLGWYVLSRAGFFLFAWPRVRESIRDGYAVIPAMGVAATPLLGEYVATYVLAFTLLKCW